MTDKEAQLELQIFQLKEHISLQNEHLEILIKAARRCAYDLRHAIDEIPTGNFLKDRIKDNPDMWLGLFNPDDIKSYRNRLSQRIEQLEMQIRSYKRTLKDHNIPDSFFLYEDE